MSVLKKYRNIHGGEIVKRKVGDRAAGWRKLMRIPRGSARQSDAAREARYQRQQARQAAEDARRELT